MLQAQWTRDGRSIVTTWDDGRIEVWSGANRADLSTFDGHGDAFAEEFETWWRKLTPRHPH